MADELDFSAVPMENASIDFSSVPREEQPPPSTFKDVAKSLGSGAIKGAINLAALPGDIRETAASFLPARTSRFMRFLPLFGGPTSQQAQQGIESLTGRSLDYTPTTEPGRWAKPIGEMLPTAAFPGGLAARIARPVLSGLGSEGLGRQFQGRPEEPYARAAGALAPGLLEALPSAARSLLVPRAATAGRQAAIATLEKEGVDALTAGRRTGSRPLQWAESHLSDIPGGGAGATIANERALEQFTQAALRRAGIAAERATPDVLDQGFRDLGTEMDRLGTAHSPDITPRVWNQLQAALRDYHIDTAPTFRSGRPEALIQQIGDASVANHGMLPGDAVASLRSDISRAIRGAGQDWKLRDVLRNIQHVMDGAVEDTIARSGATGDLGAWRNVRRQYRNLITLADAGAAAGEDAAQGLITPQRLRQTLTRGEINQRNYARGRGDFAELTRAGNEVMGQLPQSGTSPRLHITSTLGAAGAAIAELGTHHPETAGLILAGMGVGPAAGRTIMSGPAQRFLARPSPGLAPTVARAAAPLALTPRISLPALPSLEGLVPAGAKEQPQERRLGGVAHQENPDYQQQVDHRQGGGPVPDVEDYEDRLTGALPRYKGLENVARRYFNRLTDLPRRIFESSENLRQGGDYDPSPSVEAALRASRFGSGLSLPALALRSGMQRYLAHGQPEPLGTSPYGHAGPI
jgi:hypothetical protein